VLRDHEIFHTPLAVDVKKTVSINTPPEWQDEIAAAQVTAVPLARDPKGQHPPGWCTYTFEYEGSPELEVMCGGINHKTPRAGALWRQGHLLHFGFDIAPAAMNEICRAMLINAIVYISRFTDDRPIVHTPCGFVQGHWIWDRAALDRMLARKSGDLNNLQFYVHQPYFEKHLKGKSRQDVARWHAQYRDFLCAADDGRLTVDEDARSFGIGPAASEFMTQAFAALDEPTKAPLARKLLARYVPEGPGADASPARWRSWWQENRPYLFFSDIGGYRWYLDPLARKRGVPTNELRGVARATLKSPTAIPGG